METLDCVIHGGVDESGNLVTREVSVVLSPGSLLNVHCVKDYLGPGHGAVHVCREDGSGPALLPIDSSGDSRVPFRPGTVVHLHVPHRSSSSAAAASSSHNNNNNNNTPSGGTKRMRTATSSIAMPPPQFPGGLANRSTGRGDSDTDEDDVDPPCNGNGKGVQDEELEKTRLVGAPAEQTQATVVHAQPATRRKSMMMVRGETETKLEGNQVARWEFRTNKGWTAFAEDATARIEQGFQEGQPNVEINVNRVAYLVDLEASLQWRVKEPERRRQIRRQVMQRFELSCICCSKPYLAFSLPEEPAPDTDLCDECLASGE